MAKSFPSPNEVFQDRYRIVSVINRGGFGRVYRASQLELNRDVAIKVLQPVRKDNEDADQEAKRLAVVQKRFEREAQLVCQLRDSHTVVMHDYGTTDDGLLYMVLEYVDGRPLNQVIEEDGALAPDRVVKIARQVLWSLQEAHALTMLHRDVKPQNIMLFDHAGRVDQVKVLDFGLAKSAESSEFRGEDPDLTGEEVILGTPRYMSPEQIRGEPLHPSSDIYSLGLVMYEMLTGRKAVEGDSTMTTLARHLNDQPFALPRSVEMPHSLREIVERMILKDAPQRLQSAEETLEALEFWDSSTGVLAAEDSDPMIDSLLGEDRKKAAIAVLIGAMSLFLIVAVVGAATREDPRAEVINDLERESGETESAALKRQGLAAAVPGDEGSDSQETKQPKADDPTEEVDAEKPTEDHIAKEPVAPESDPADDLAMKPSDGIAEDSPAEEETLELVADDTEPAAEAAEPVSAPAAPTTSTTGNGSTKSNRSGNKGRDKKKTGLKIGILK